VVKVHAGFQMALGSVKAELLQKLQEYKGKGYDIVIAGHSLGGTISTLLAVELCAMDLFQKISLVTWGAPPVGNIAFANLFRSYSIQMESHRFFVPSDPVPHLLCWNPHYSHTTPGKPLGGPLATILRTIGSATAVVSIVSHLSTYLNQKKNQLSFEQCGKRVLLMLSSHKTSAYGWMPHNAGFGFLDLAPSILHSNWFWDYIS
jgi:hypothetical protein